MAKPLVAFLWAAAQLAPPAQAQDAPAATPLWTIATDGCVSVNADGPSWRVCGFQRFVMNDDASRILTVSSTGVIELWDGAGRQLMRLDWPDDWHSGASGYPDGWVLIVGNIGVAVTHHNQLVTIDLADGRILSRTTADIMLFDEFRLVGGRLFARIKERDWSLAIREIVLPSGELRAVPGATAWTSLEQFEPRTWVTGARAPFTVLPARPEGAAAADLRGCRPVEQFHCFWTDRGGRYVHVLDLRAGGGRSFDIGAPLGDQDTVDFVVAGARPYAILCRPSSVPYPSRRPCSIRDLADWREIYAFETSHVAAVGGRDEQGRPEIRMALTSGTGEREQRRVAADGSARLIDAQSRAGLTAPGGGMILPGADAATSLLVDRAGRPVVRLPVPAQVCVYGPCPISADLRRWLLPSLSPVEGGEEDDRRLGLTLYEIPVLAP